MWRSLWMWRQRDFFRVFTVTIPEVLELRRKYDLLELLLLDGEEKITALGSVRVDDLDELESRINAGRISY